MADGFTANNQRKILAAFEDALPAAYRPRMAVSTDNKSVNITVADPQNAPLMIASVTFVWQEYRTPDRRRQMQPSDAELADVVQSFVNLCNEHAGTAVA